MTFIIFIVVALGLQIATLLSAAYFYKKKQKVLCAVAIYFVALMLLALWAFTGEENFLAAAVLQFAFSFSYSVHIFSKEV